MNCGSYCNHTDAEHAAFDLGVDWGRAQGLEAGNPFTSAAEREAFEHGKSVGVKAHVNEWPPVKTAQQHADQVWCDVYSELSARYQEEHSGDHCGGHEYFFNQKRKVVEAQAMADPRVIEANALAMAAKEKEGR